MSHLCICQEIGHRCNMFTITNYISISLGLIFSYKLCEMSFIEVYMKQIYVEPFIYIIWGHIHIDLKVRTFNYNTCVTSKQYGNYFVISYLRKIIILKENEQLTQNRPCGTPICCRWRAYRRRYCRPCKRDRLQCRTLSLRTDREEDSKGFSPLRFVNGWQHIRTPGHGLAITNVSVK